MSQTITSEQLNHSNKSIERTEQRIGFPIYERRKRAIIYCRVSTDKQEQDGESLEYQEEKCRQYAELHDMGVLMVLKEVKRGKRQRDSLASLDGPYAADRHCEYRDISYMQE